MPSAYRLPAVGPAAFALAGRDGAQPDATAKTTAAARERATCLFPLSPVLRGEGRGEGRFSLRSSDCGLRIEDGPSPHPSPPITGERGTAGLRWLCGFDRDGKRISCHESGGTVGIVY